MLCGLCLEQQSRCPLQTMTARRIWAPFNLAAAGYCVQLIEAGGKLYDLSQDNYGFDFGLDNSSCRGPCDYKVSALCDAAPRVLSAFIELVKPMEDLFGAPIC